MDRCIYEPLHGQFPDCDGACRKGENNICPYYLVDKVWHIMHDWKKEANVETPIVWKWDSKRNKICIYTTKPGYFIGLHGKRYQKFVKILSEADPEHFKENGVDIVECDDGIGD